MGRHLRSFTAAFKLQVIEYAEEHGKREAGRKFDVDEKRLRYWMKQKDALAATNGSRKAFRGKKCKYPELEGELVKYSRRPFIRTRREPLKSPNNRESEKKRIHQKKALLLAQRPEKTC